MKAKVEMIEGAKYRTYGGDVTEPLERSSNGDTAFPWYVRHSDGLLTTYTKDGHEYVEEKVGSAEDLVEMVYDPRPPDFEVAARDLYLVAYQDPFGRKLWEYNRIQALLIAALKAEYEATKGEP